MNKCIECKYEFSVSDIHECRRFPPVVSYIMTSFPVIIEDDWCGEFKHKPTKEQELFEERLEAIDMLED